MIPEASWDSLDDEGDDIDEEELVVMMPPGTQSSPWLLSPLGRAWGVRSE
jgi:hypothetical protein